ncbi:MAG: hypothetical protein QM652_01630 [Legionella sp.]|uniref:hypothetical protein n=1 Tax=Legionella sp. TaxID=459 RepID=UPI0039E2D40D
MLSSFPLREKLIQKRSYDLIDYTVLPVDPKISGNKMTFSIGNQNIKSFLRTLNNKIKKEPLLKGRIKTNRLDGLITLTFLDNIDNEEEQKKFYNQTVKSIFSKGKKTTGKEVTQEEKKDKHRGKCAGAAAAKKGCTKTDFTTNATKSKDYIQAYNESYDKEIRKRNITGSELGTPASESSFLNQLAPLSASILENDNDLGSDVAETNSSLSNFQGEEAQGYLPNFIMNAPFVSHLDPTSHSQSLITDLEHQNTTSSYSTLPNLIVNYPNVLTNNLSFLSPINLALPATLHFPSVNNEEVNYTNYSTNYDEGITSELPTIFAQKDALHINDQSFDNSEYYFPACSFHQTDKPTYTMAPLADSTTYRLSALKEQINLPSYPIINKLIPLETSRLNLHATIATSPVQTSQNGAKNPSRFFPQAPLASPPLCNSNLDLSAATQQLAKKRKI